MKVYTCILLLKIFAYRHTTEAQNPPTENQRSVNLALETVLEFSNKDHSADVKFLDNVQHFITKVKTVIDKNKNARRVFKAPKVETLTDFIVEVINTVDQFQDAMYQDFYEILDEEIRKYHYRGCKFYELTENLEIRKLLADKLNLIRGKSIFVIKSYVNALTEIIKSRNYDKHVKDLVDYINSLYRQDSREKFKEILADLNFYSNTKSKRSNTNLVKVIRAGIRTIIFDHYTKLNPNARRALKSKIETFWKQYKQNSSTSSKSENFLDVVNDSYGKLDIPEFSTPDNAEYRYKDSTPHKKERDEQTEKRIEIKKSDYKKKSIMRDGVKEKKVESVPKYTKIDVGYEDDEVQKVTSRKAADVQSTTNKNSENLSERSSTEERGVDLTGETLERNSIEQYQKHQEEINTQRYMTLYPEPIAYNEKVTEDPEHIVHRSGKMMPGRPIVQTMWIEEATGRIPKAMIQKYNEMTKDRHVKSKPKYQSRERKHWSNKVSKHESKHGTRHIKRQGKKHELKQKRKHKPKHKRNKHSDSKHKPVISRLLPKHKKAKIFSQDHAFIDVATMMEFYEYKKMMDPARIDSRTKLQSSTTPKTSTPMGTIIPVRIPVRVPGRVPEKVLEGDPERVPERAPERAPERVPERFSKRVPERVPITVTKRSTVPTRFSLATRPSVPPRPSVPSRLIIPNQPLVLTSLSKSPTNWMVTAPLQLYSERYELLTGKKHRTFRKNYPYNLIQDKKRKTFRRQSVGNISDKFHIDAEINVIKRINDLEKELNEVKNKMNDIQTEETKLKKIADKLVINDKMEKSKMFELGLRKGINSLRKDSNLKKNSSKILESQNLKEKEYKTEFRFVKEKDKPFEEVKIKSLTTKHEVTDTKTTKITKRPETDDKNGETKTNDLLNKNLKDSKTDNKVKLMIGDYRSQFGFQDWKNDGQDEGGFKNYDQDDVWKDSFRFYTKPTTKGTTTKPTKSTTRSETTTTIKSTKTERISSMVELFISVPSLPPSTNNPVTKRKDTKSQVPTVEAAIKNKTTKILSQLAEPSKNITKVDLKKEITPKSNLTIITTLKVFDDVNDTRILSADQFKKRKEVTYSSLPIWSSNTSSTNGFYFTDPFEGIDDGIAIPVKK